MLVRQSLSLKCYNVSCSRHFFTTLKTSVTNFVIFSCTSEARFKFILYLRLNICLDAKNFFFQIGKYYRWKLIQNSWQHWNKHKRVAWIVFCVQNQSPISNANHVFFFKGGPSYFSFFRWLAPQKLRFKYSCVQPSTEAAVFFSSLQSI